MPPRKEHRRASSDPADESHRGRLVAVSAISIAVGGLLLLASLTSVAVASPGLISMSLATYNWDGSPGLGSVDFGEVSPAAAPAVVAPAFTATVSSDLSWELTTWRAALPAGCSLEHSLHGAGSWSAVGEAATPALANQPPCASQDHSFDYRLTVDWSVPPGNYSVVVHLEAGFTDDTAPQGQLAINSGQTHTNSLAVTLDLSGTTDPGSDPSGVDAVCFSPDGVTWTAWQDYTSTVAYTLTGPDGVNTVWAKFRDRAGNESSSVSDSIILDRVAPQISAVVVTNRTDSTADVSWTIDDPTALSQVEYWISPPAAVEPNPAAAVTTAHLTGLVGSSLYTYRVVATDLAGNQSASPEGTFWTLCSPPATLMVAEKHGNKVELTLNWSASSGATGYNVYRSAEQFTELPMPEPPPSPPFPFWAYSSDTTEGPDVVSADYFRYQYYVTALNGAGEESAISNVVMALGDGAPPQIVSGPDAAPSTNSCTITWETDEPATSQVHYGTTPGSYPLASSPDGSLVTSHSVLITGLQANTTYYYVVVSTDTSGNEVQSAEFSFTTGPGTGPSLWVVEIWPNWHRIEFQWDPWPGVTEYRVYRAPTDSPPVLPAAPTPPPAPWELQASGLTDTSWVDGNLGPTNTWTYTWVVMAYSATGESVYTNTVTLSRSP